MFFQSPFGFSHWQWVLLQLLDLTRGCQFTDSLASVIENSAQPCRDLFCSEFFRRRSQHLKNLFFGITFVLTVSVYHEAVVAPDHSPITEAAILALMFEEFADRRYRR